MVLKLSKKLYVIFLLFAAWSYFFIFNASVVGFDGRRYFSLFDDAMISMRYAWNFSHGQGLVWNIGERVEGYTNPLMVFFMSLFTSVLDKSSAVLAIQISGILIVIACCIIFLRIATIFISAFPELTRPHLISACVIAFLTYYPFLFWTLTGMETGILTLLLLSTLLNLELLYLRKKTIYLFIIGILQGLAYLTRPDALLYTLPIFFYVAVTSKSIIPDQKSRIVSLITSFSLVLFFVVGLEIFRVAYYHEWLPNTYILKMTGMPLIDRLSNGLGFMSAYFQTHFFVLFISVIGIFLLPSPRKWLYGVLILISILYQIWVGGDPWPYWRMLTPVASLLMLLFLSSVKFILKNLNFKSNFYQRGWTFFFAALSGIFLSNYPFMGQIFLVEKPYLTEYYDVKVNTALAINEITTLSATLGVYSAGTIPYYADRYSIDFLGKMDKHLALLSPDLSGNISWAGMYSVPGHNKYDLNYSIKQLSPTYIQYPNWRGDDITVWAQDYYSLEKYNGVDLWLRKNSSDVKWDYLYLP